MMVDYVVHIFLAFSDLVIIGARNMLGKASETFAKENMRIS